MSHILRKSYALISQNESYVKRKMEVIYHEDGFPTGKGKDLHVPKWSKTL